MESGITITAPRATISSVEKVGQQWMRLHPSLEWVFEGFLIVRAENGERLILCDIERHTSLNDVRLEARPVVRSDVPMWNHPSREE